MTAFPKPPRDPMPTELSGYYRKCWDLVPAIKRPHNLDVAAVPPFGGALVRYRVTKGRAQVSIYFDGHDALGCVGKPYWEIHPGAEDETERFLMHETDELVSAVKTAIRRQLRK